MKRKVFTNFQLFDGKTDQLRSNKIIVVEENRITRVEDVSALPRYAAFERVDLDGLTLLPGLIDAHVQIGVPFIRRVNFRAILDMPRQLKQNLLYQIMVWIGLNLLLLIKKRKMVIYHVV